MPDVFDPYYDWLGIPPEEQPADHYRLLGLRQFEANAAAIANSADQRIHLLRSAQIGKRMAESQKLLNEVAAASATLLNAERKRAYDEQLRERLSPQVATIPPPVQLEQTLLHSGPPPVVPKKPDAPNPRELPATRQHSPSDLSPMATDVEATFKVNIPAIQLGGAAIGTVAVLVTLIAILAQSLSGDTDVANLPPANTPPIAHAPTISEVNPELPPEVDPVANPVDANPPQEVSSAPQAAVVSPAAAVALANTAPVAAAVATPVTEGTVTTVPEPVVPVEVVPEPAKVKALAGLPNAVTLPKLPTSTETPAADALAPVSLGPCMVPPEKLVVISLKGGDTIVKAGKQKLLLVAAEGGTAAQDWDIHVYSDTASAVIARLGVKDQQLMFQWTPEGAHEAAAALLMNCALEIHIGNERRVVSLRTPVVSEPFIVDFEKPTLSLKWVIEEMPDPSNVVVQVAKVTGLTYTKLDPDSLLERNGAEAILWTGPSDDTMILGLKLKATLGAKSVSVAAVPQFKLQGMNQPEPYVKRKFHLTAQQIEQTLALMMQRLNVIQGDKRLSDLEKVNRRALLEQNMGGALNDIEIANAHTRHLKQIVTEVSGKAQINFRVYYLADDVQVDLLTTAPPTD